MIVRNVLKKRVLPSTVSILGLSKIRDNFEFKSANSNISIVSSKFNSLHK